MIKPNSLLHGAIFMASMLSLISCNTLVNLSKADKQDTELMVGHIEESTVKPGTQMSHRGSASKKVVTEHTPVDGEWTIVGIGQMNIRRDENMPYVIFSDVEGRFYASNGCNVINGDFSYTDGNTLTFADAVSSHLDCPDIEFQKDISSVFNSGVSVKIKSEDKHRETYMNLYSNSNDLLLTLRKHNLEVINGQWEVVEIGKEEIDGSEINLFFDIPERSIHGNTGCNFFNGAIIIDPNKASAISFSQMGVTMRYCDNSDVERMLLVALEETETYQLKDNDTLILCDHHGKHLITLHRQPL